MVKNLIIEDSLLELYIKNGISRRTAVFYNSDNMFFKVAADAKLFKSCMVSG